MIIGPLLSTPLMEAKAGNRVRGGGSVRQVNRLAPRSKFASARQIRHDVTAGLGWIRRRIHGRVLVLNDGAVFSKPKEAGRRGYDRYLDRRAGDDLGDHNHLLLDDAFINGPAANAANIDRLLTNGYPPIHCLRGTGP